MELPAELEGRQDEVITHFPISKRSAALPLLHLIQEHFGYIQDEAITWVAAKLGLEPINVLELVTFYPMLRREPAGKHHIRVCRTLACAMAGSYQLRETFCKHAGIKQPSNGHGAHILKSEDGKYSIEFVECLASCGFAPVCMINDDFFEAVTEDEVPQLLERYE
ncbi:MAG: NAD(P)H-dependent oxidoreductase subunit E [Verrucomicrobia bacterium]|nr:NAD(P)H-dependent oxidoreductase subunit E [Verrucomicrobiota bacterium]